MSFRYFEVAGHAAVYNKFRHSPPPGLIEKIVNYTKEKTVVGFDPSHTQVEEACKQYKVSNVFFRVGRAEQMDLADGSVQLVTASQACHWFDMAKFYSEVGRVLQPNGVLAMYCYRLPLPVYRHTIHLGDIVEKYYIEVLSDYILPQSKKAYLGGYTDEEFCKIPFVQEPLIRHDSSYAEFPVTVADLVGYVSTWSGFQNYRKHEGEEKSSHLLKQFEKEIMDAVGVQNPPEEIILNIKYPYFLIMGRKSAK